jgi:hypothetical protein
MTANSGSSPGGPLVMNASPHRTHIARTQRRSSSGPRCHASTKANIAAVSNSVSSTSVETTFAPMTVARLNA